MTTQAATMHATTAPAPGISRGMAGMVFFIGSEIMLFGGLFAAYFFVRSQAAEWPPLVTAADGSLHEVHTVDAGLGSVLTVLLVLSGLVAHFGVVSAQNGNSRGLARLLGVAIVMGTVFIIGQSYEWLSLIDEGLTAKSNVYGGTFFILTGFHGAHVIAGLAMLAVAFVRSIWGDFTPRRHLFVAASVLYWHFVDIVWVFLYGLLYFNWNL